MLNKKQNINENVFNTDVEQVPLRNGFGEGLVEAADTDENVVGLCADLTGSTRMDAFAKKYPERFVQIGVAEQNLASVASGLAALGKVPFITSYAMFSPGRNWEQIRTTICYNNQPVKIIGSHAGVSVGPDGGTHQAIEDMAIMRVIPRIEVISPCDTNEAKKATIEIASSKAPTYMRLAREKTPVMTTEETSFEIGKAYEMWRGKNVDVAIIGCGPLLHGALLAAKKLEEKDIGTVVLNSHTIKPLDDETIVALAREVGAVVTLEEHQASGGLGGAVAEVLAKNEPVPIEFVGVDDLFGQSGTPEELIEHYQLDTSAIIDAVHMAIARKKVA
ncbi:transketolase family protein [Candidatus Kaiserbacteria bacterium]|nr:MAG: transketolase family protein [Candidatus Kaiserbacteria bacterium]